MICPTHFNESNHSFNQSQVLVVAVFLLVVLQVLLLLPLVVVGVVMECHLAVVARARA